MAPAVSFQRSSPARAASSLSAAPGPARCPAIAPRRLPALAPGRRPLRPAAAAAVLALVPWLAAACGPATPDPATPAPDASGTSTATPPPADSTTTPEPSATAAASAAEPPPAPPKPGVPYDSVPIPGTSPLSADEAKELKAKCKKFTDAVTAAAKKAGAGKRPIDGLFEALASPPPVAGVDAPRCADLMRRDTVEYLARTRENEAKINLRRVMVGLMGALDKSPPALCPSAPAVPAALATVRDVPYASKPEDWQAEGWKCARFDLAGGQQVFQYEMRTDDKSRSYEVIARGYPVQGGPATELYIAGKVESGALDPSTPILRR